MDEDKLHEHIHKTYHTIRYGLAVLAAAFPFVLLLVGAFFYHVKTPTALSHYYFSLQDLDPKVWSFPMRSLFVGGLCAMGCFLILYRGYSKTENCLLNLAGLSAIGVALVHTGAKNCTVCGDYVFPSVPWLHIFFAITLFVAIALVAFACSEETLGELPKNKQQSYRNSYDLHALGLISFPAVAAIATLATGYWSHVVLVMEILGVLIFARYWHVKSKEIKAIEAYRRKPKTPTSSVTPYDDRIELRKEKKPQDAPTSEQATPNVLTRKINEATNSDAVSRLRMWVARVRDDEKMTELPRLKLEPQRRMPVPASK